jgi:dihydroorotate dehydrogenase
MYDTITAIRNTVIRILYKGILKPVFFLNDPETVHDSMSAVGKSLGAHTAGRTFTAALFDYQNPVLKQTVAGITFQNPIGLSAGFDKNAELTDILPSVGFGFAEVGSITGNPCAGNPKPRLWRLPKSKSLAVYYGLKNNGCESIALKLQQKLAERPFAIPVGVSVAMTNCKENADDITKGIEDFAKAFRTMEPVASYITVNISCPNTHGGQPFIDPNNFDRLFKILDTIPTDKPIFIKLSPDLSDEQLDALLAVMQVHRIHGLICTNLTKKRQNEKIIDANIPEVGGLSGKVVQDLSDRMIARIYKKVGKKYIIIGCGGVFTAEDAYKKIRLGSTLIHMITGMIFEGPQVISDINLGLVKLLKRDGFTSISQAIGVDVNE